MAIPLPWFPRSRRFGTRLLLLIVGLVAMVQGATYYMVARIDLENAVERIRDTLVRGAPLFDKRVAEKLDELAGRARLMSGDYAIRSLFLQDQLDAQTVRSALKSYLVRINAPFMVLLAPDGSLLGDTGGPLPAGSLGSFRLLMRSAAQIEDDPRKSGFAWLPGEAGGEGKIYALLVVPLYAPAPEIVAWIGLAFPIDRDFAENLKQISNRLDVTFLYSAAGGAVRPIESTLPRSEADETARQAGGAAVRGTPVRILTVHGQSYVTDFRRLPLLTPGIFSIALQRSLEAELEPERQLQRLLLILFPAALVVAAFIAMALARNVSRPVQALAAHTEIIAKGDYNARLNLDRQDELGRLATAFNRMSEGLAERDRVRDLLDKNVSPEVAAQLLREGAVLGGEEREVTILFVDLRSFTSMTEPLPPRDVLALLNRYFDRMSGVIESHHGIVDKYIGDAIMALFGAPVAQSDAADQALTAALEMDQALARLNGELAAEGRRPLSHGIGVNTSRVVAGNMGSSRRLNYSVVGDGVNVAARLQDLTRTPQYAATILASGATLRAARRAFLTRALGAVTVRGRSEPVELFAVDGVGSGME